MTKADRRREKESEDRVPRQQKAEPEMSSIHWEILEGDCALPVKGPTVWEVWQEPP